MKLVALVCAVAITCFTGQAVHAAPTNYIVNGGFETGDFTGWSAAGDNTYVNSSFYSYVPNTGTYAAYLGAVSILGSLTQTFTDMAGQALTIGFSLASDGSTPNEFRVDFNGATLFDSVNIVSQAYMPYSFTVTATGTDTLTFYERNEPGFLSLDDVSVVVTAVPEPASLALLGAGLVGAGVIRRRRAA